MLTRDELAEMRQRLMDPKLPHEELQWADHWRVGELLGMVELLQADLDLANGFDSPQPTTPT
jgi:hypothetical protein